MNREQALIVLETIFAELREDFPLASYQLWSDARLVEEVAAMRGYAHQRDMDQESAFFA